MSMYADNQHKFVAVVNPKIDIPKLMNGLGHITAGLMAQAKNLEEKFMSIFLSLCTQILTAQDL